MSPEEPEHAPASPDDASADVSSPRLGLIHLLTWTACVAANLGLRRYLTGLAGGPDVAEEAYLAGVTVLHSVCWGAVLGGVLMWIARRLRGLPFPQHPGEYLLVVLGLEVAWVFADASAVLAIGAAYWMSWPRIILSIGCCSLVFVWPVLRVARPRWRFFFVALLADRVLDRLLLWRVVLYGPTVAWTLMFAWPRWILLVSVPVLLVFAVLRDWRRGDRYPWTHWVGVAVLLCLTVVDVVGPFVLTWLRYLNS
jgi:hypothetical protein